MKHTKKDVPHRIGGSNYSALKWIVKTAEGSWAFLLVYSVISSLLAYLGILTAYGTRDIVNGAAEKDLLLLKHGAILLLILV